MSELTPDKTRNQGFTLLEILLVVGVIAILAGIVIVAINPGRQLATVRNTQRKMNLGEINKALQQYYIDNRSYPDSVTTTLTEICNTGTGTTTHSVTCTDLVDLSPLVPTYLTAIPTDPQATSTGSGYMVMKDTANKIVLLASDAELGVKFPQAD
jgi:prepilin-type N-terminal cleavage/methylation domain-containing protein